METLPEQLLFRLQEQIVRGELTPGQRLAESELASRYGVSRGPLREAIRRLEARRLVEVAPRTGARVVDFDAEQLADVYQAREALEGMAARLAAQAMTDAEIEQLSQLLDHHEQSIAADEGQHYLQDEGDVDFHYRLAAGSHNAVLVGMLCDELYQLVRLFRHRFSSVRDRPITALSEHRAIVEALRERDGELAELLMRRHIAKARRSALSAFADAQANAAGTKVKSASTERTATKSSFQTTTSD